MQSRLNFPRQRSSDIYVLVFVYQIIILALALGAPGGLNKSLGQPSVILINFGVEFESDSEEKKGQVYGKKARGELIAAESASTWEYEWK